MGSDKKEPCRILNPTFVYRRVFARRRNNVGGGDGAVNANFKVEQGLVQKEYVFWKYAILKSLVFTEPKISFRYDSGGKRYPKS